jgi:hypothetical protein
MPPVAPIAAVAMPVETMAISMTMTMTMMARNVATGVRAAAASPGALRNQRAQEDDNSDDKNDIKRRPHSSPPFRPTQFFCKFPRTAIAAKSPIRLTPSETL